MPAPTNISQGNIISNINSYLSAQNLPIKFDEEGVCLGLSTLHAKYFMENNIDEFNALLQMIAGKKTIHKVDELKLFTFIEQVLALFALSEEKSNTYNHYNQANSYKLLGMKNAPPFTLGMKTQIENWSQIFKDINLQENEVIVAHDAGHAISIIRTDKGYAVYDPNQAELYQHFNSEQEMVKWLAHTALNLGMADKAQASELDLNIKIFSNNLRNEETPFPSKNEIYSKYLQQPQQPRDIEQTSAFTFAIFNDDVESLQIFLKDADKKTWEYAQSFSIKLNSSKCLTELLTDDLRTEKVIEYMNEALSAGSAEAFYLMKEKYPKAYNTFINSEQHLKNALKNAVEGGNNLLIKEILKSLSPVGLKATSQSQKTTHINHFDHLFRAQLINTLIQQNNHMALNSILQEMYHEKAPPASFNLDQKISFLRAAIFKNSPLLVRELIENMKLSAEEINTIDISLKQSEALNIEVLKQLEDHGYEFNSAQKSVMSLKENQTIGVIKHLGIALKKFTEYFTLKEDVSVNVNKMNTLKEKIQSIKPSAPEELESQKEFKI